MASSWFVKMILVKKFKLVNTPMDKREIHIAQARSQVTQRLSLPSKIEHFKLGILELILFMMQVKLLKLLGSLHFLEIGMQKTQRFLSDQSWLYRFTVQDRCRICWHWSQT